MCSGDGYDDRENPTTVSAHSLQKEREDEEILDPCSLESMEDVYEDYMSRLTLGHSSPGWSTRPTPSTPSTTATSMLLSTTNRGVYDEEISEVEPRRLPPTPTRTSWIPSTPTRSTVVQLEGRQ